MYKIVNIVDLKKATNFIESDKLIEISEDGTKMFVGENDYAHKNNSYLSNAIDIVDNTLNSYTSAIDEINSTYLTADLNKTYLPDGSLITQATLDKILNSDAFLTKEGCKKLETECLSYISDMKNKAVSIIMAQLNNSFITQNSVDRLAYGQKAKGSGNVISYQSKITLEELPNETSPDYNLDTGEFSLPYLIYNVANINPEDEFGMLTIDDYWKDNYISQDKTFDKDFDSFENMKLDIPDNVYAFNAKGVNGDKTTDPDVRVHVTDVASFDNKKNKTIPIAKLAEFFLKKQIKKSIKFVCDSYISRMTSIPKKIPG